MSKVAKYLDSDVYDICWACSAPDGSICALVAVTNQHETRVFMGSRGYSTTPEGDAEYIAAHGDEINQSIVDQITQWQNDNKKKEGANDQRN